jgi:hypothetical protein
MMTSSIQFRNRVSQDNQSTHVNVPGVPNFAMNSLLLQGPLCIQLVYYEIGVMAINEGAELRHVKSGINYRLLV